jgi:hypothetical protein
MMMNIKSKSYMENTEFKERQGRFEFFCVQAYEFIKQFKKDCQAGWKKLFTIKLVNQVQLSFEFSSPFNKGIIYLTP